MIVEWIAQHPDVVRAVVAVAGVVIICAAAWILGHELPEDDTTDEDEHAKNPFRW